VIRAILTTIGAALLGACATTRPCVCEYRVEPIKWSPGSFRSIPEYDGACTLEDDQIVCPDGTVIKVHEYDGTLTLDQDFRTAPLEESQPEWEDRIIQ
jgi:hypothetical protein